MKLRPFDPSQIGYLFMVGLPGPSLDENTRELIRKKGICGFILFRRNIINPRQLQKLCFDLSSFCETKGLPRPFIAIDQEGGTVARLPPPFSQFPDARDLASGGEPYAELTNYARICAAELCKMGINMNLAPVLDVCPLDPGYFMGRRSLGSDPRKVAQFGRLVITEMQNSGIAACAKHFPGLGSATLDPHHDLPTVNSTLEKIMELDVVPFQAAINVGVAAIMTSHTIYNSLDAKNPATISFPILTDFLRKKLRFEGVIITDDLEMGAIEKNGHVADAALASFMAGADMLLICHLQEKVHKAISVLADAWKEGLITEERIITSLRRLSLLRSQYVKPTDMASSLAFTSLVRRDEQSSFSVS